MEPQKGHHLNFVTLYVIPENITFHYNEYVLHILWSS